jgi:UDP-N-acetylglucosamine diphosphorylase/glucosamine-1-phosphate N-acetyltransferase
MEGSFIRRPFALCTGSVVKMGAKIYGPTTVGPHSKVGGELNNVVIFGNSNKAHDGFLGNTVVGEWCNFGADTNCSNLKNDYAEVRQWNYPEGKFVKTGLQFCGLVMGDYSRTAINTMLNTGTVVGVGANIYGSGFPRNFVPSFMWGGSAGFKPCTPETLCQVAERVLARRGLQLSDIDRQLIADVFGLTAKYRGGYKS